MSSTSSTTTTPSHSHSHSHSLTQEIKTAIAQNDVQQLYKLKDICDRIHSTGNSYLTYSPSDLPTDTLYEEMCRKIDSIASDYKIITQKGISSSTNASYIRKDGQGISSDEVKHRHEKYISDMWMGSITKLTEINEMKDAMLLPKFDGCSCGVKLRRGMDGKFELVEALTRGTDQGYETKKSNITEKFSQISEKLITTLSTKDYEFENGRHLSDVYSLTLRGEIVLKNKTTTTSAPASFVAGKINGYMEVWNEAVDTMEFVPYEIMRLYFDKDDKFDIYVPTQLEVIDLLELFGLFNYPYELLDLTADSLPLIQKHFDTLLHKMTEPIDGVVYCSQRWQYPLRTEDTKPKGYGKYAWKPNSEATSTLTSISYSLARDGKFTFILGYEPVKIGPKNYHQAKTATSRMELLNGIGIGSVITIKLAGDISPMVVDFIEDEKVEPYELPTKCPFCGHPTKLRNGKTPILSCTNPACREITKQKMINFLQTLGIKGIAEGKLNALKTITLKSVNTTYLYKTLSLKDFLNTIDTRTFLMALGIGGKTKINKMIPESINPLLPIANNFEAVFELVEDGGYYDNDPFINEVMDYISELLF